MPLMEQPGLARMRQDMTEVSASVTRALEGVARHVRELERLGADVVREVDVSVSELGLKKVISRLNARVAQLELVLGDLPACDHSGDACFVCAEPCTVGHPCRLDLARQALTGGVVVPPIPLTPRQTQIVGMLAGGATNEEIAARLGISPLTVRTHVANILSRLRMSTRAGAVGRMYQLILASGGGVEGLDN